jgi:hypothetical protein
MNFQPSAPFSSAPTLRPGWTSASFRSPLPWNARRTESRRPTLELARACAAEASVGAQKDSQGLLFLAGCALSVAAGCAFHMEKFVAHWDTFESFVRALIA